MYLSLYCKGSKRVTQGLRVRGSWRPNITTTFWPPLLWLSALCLSRSPGLLNRGLSSLVDDGFPYCILSATSLDPNSIGGPEPLRPGVAFPTTSCLRRLWSPTQSGAPRAPSAWRVFPYHNSSLTPTLTSCLDWVI